MKYGIYAIKDTKIGFMNPFYSHNNQTAVRSFTNGANDTIKNEINTNPEDKELWRVGEFDDQTGEIKAEIEFLTTAISVTKVKE